MAASDDTLEEVKSQLAVEMAAAYRACPYSFLSRDYFARIVRDPDAHLRTDEVAIGADWRIVVADDADPLARRMGDDLAEFLAQRMALTVPVGAVGVPGETDPCHAILLLDSDGSEAPAPGSYTISATPERIVVRGADAAGLRDGIVRLVDDMGFRQAAFIPLGERIFTPRVGVRLGVPPWMGSYRDLVFMGCNAVLLNTYFEGEEGLFALSRSDALPELASRRKPEVLRALDEAAREAKRYGLRVYAQISTRKKFAKDHPVFAAHPEVRGALTWKADGDYTLCTEHPLVQRYLAESVEGLFEDVPLDGLLLINGGESFYHCFMRPYGVAKGHTNCARCEPLGAETVVANLSNRLLEAARRVNPTAEIVAWPYSAEQVWSADRYQVGLIEKLHPGAGIFTEIEKDEVAEKPEGVRKAIADYSIDLIGPGQRAIEQVAACRRAGIPIYIKSEPELGFEAPRLPSIPCLDRWTARAEALVACGADGAWILPYFRPNFGTASSEVFKYFWWEPTPTADEILLAMAGRIAGPEAGPHLRAAWKHVSNAIDWSPEIPAYYTGPYYLGPAHPMCVVPDAPLPEVFYGRFLFMGEMTDEEGLRLRPTFLTSPTGNVEVFGRFYRNMEACLRQAVEALDAAEPAVPDRNRLTFDAAASPIRWFYHTARTHANFYESCRIRDALTQFAAQETRASEETAVHRARYERWREVLLDERANTRAALPLVEADMRLDCHYGFDHTFPHAADMIRAKLEILDREICEALPEMERRAFGR